MLFDKNDISARDRALRAGGFVLAAIALGFFFPKVLLGLASVGIIIFVHELGHFTVCKLSGIKVEAFSLGFGAPLIAYDHGGTRYQIAVLPLGGYVKPKGEFEEKEDMVGRHDPDEFLGKPWWIRALVLAAGPLFNFIFPVIFLFGLYATVGLPLTIAPPEGGRGMDL